MLWKFYPFGGLIDGGYLADGDKLTCFIRQHLGECHPRGRQLHLDGNPGFVLHSESEAKQDILDDLAEILDESDEEIEGRVAMNKQPCIVCGAPGTTRTRDYEMRPNTETGCMDTVPSKHTKVWCETHDPHETSTPTLEGGRVIMWKFG